MAIGKIKPIRKIGKVGKKRLVIKGASLEDVPARLPSKQSTESPEVRDAMEVMETTDVKFAKKILKLKQGFVQATFPEMITYDWLASQGLAFVYQGEIYGGRRLPGGLLPDFVIDVGGAGIAWQINGEYWHSRLDQKANDATNNIRLLGQLVNGLEIQQVVVLWERDIYKRRPFIFQMALGGLGIGPNR